MNSKQLGRLAVKWSGFGIGFAVTSYAAYAAVTFIRYGSPKPARGGNADALLDIFMPNYEIVDRHSVRIAAPADVTLFAATEMDLESRPIIRAIFKGREFILRSKPD